jgi:hypothetical protein
MGRSCNKKRENKNHQFLTKNSHEIDIQVSYESNKIDNTHNIKFLVLLVDTSILEESYCPTGI